MPIFTSAVDGVLCLEFGAGDIFVTTARTADSKTDNAVAFLRPDEPGQIGDWTDKYSGKSSVDPEIDVASCMIFNKVESIDVVIQALQVVRANLVTLGQSAG